MPKLIPTEEYWTREQVEADTDRNYLFGDNLKRVGNAGQACIRNLENAWGIPTKETPSMEPNAFFSDWTYKAYRAITEAVNEVPLDKDVVYNPNIGLGLAKLDQHAPHVYTHLRMQIEKLRLRLEGKKLLNTAITGGLCCGKTTVCDNLRTRGYRVFDADEQIRQYLCTSEFSTWLEGKYPEQAKILIRARRQNIVQYYNILRRMMLEDKLFETQYVNHLHSQIGPMIINGRDQYDFFELPLLFERKLQYLFTNVLVVHCSPNVQRERAMVRYMEKEVENPAQTVDSLLKKQIPLTIKVAMATHTLHTDDTLQTMVSLEALLPSLLPPGRSVQRTPQPPKVAKVQPSTKADVQEVYAPIS